MKKRYDFFIDVAQFPLIALFIAVILIGIGNVLVHPGIAFFWSVTSDTIIYASAFLRCIGGFLIAMLPLVLLVKLLSKRFDDSSVCFIGIMSFIVLNITTMFFASSKLPSDAYASIMGMQLNMANFSLAGNMLRYPLQTGIVSSFLCYYLTKLSFSRTRNRKTYGLFSFIDKNTLAMILVIIFSIIAGIVVSYVWAYFIRFVYGVFQFIADDITNPFNMFLYGASERLLGSLNLSQLPRNAFWFNDFGGSWIDMLGRKYSGDVAIWTAQAASGSVASGVGRFITPLYVINLFAIPGYIIALFTLVTNRFEKRKYLGFVILAIIASMICGNSLPFDLFILCASPLLFGIHVFVSSMCFAFFEWAKIYMGFSYVGVPLLASAGSFADLWVYIKSPAMIQTVSQVCIVGVFVAVLYFILTRLYYQFLAIDMFQSGHEKALITHLVSDLGGIENIKVIDSNIMKLLIQVKNDQLVDIAHLRTLCRSKVFESKTGYVLYFYKASPKLCYVIKQMLKEQGTAV